MILVFAKIYVVGDGSGGRKNMAVVFIAIGNIHFGGGGGGGRMAAAAPHYASDGNATVSG